MTDIEEYRENLPPSAQEAFDQVEEEYNAELAWAGIELTIGQDLDRINLAEYEQEKLKNSYKKSQEALDIPEKSRTRFEYVQYRDVPTQELRNRIRRIVNLNSTGESFSRFELRRIIFELDKSKLNSFETNRDARLAVMECCGEDTVNRSRNVLVKKELKTVLSALEAKI